ncbi:MAG: YcxB family protein, partial [Lachnospiraceae bacterium]
DSHCSCTVDRSSFHLRISDHAVDVRHPLSQLTCAFELSHLFLFYISAQDVYLLPKRSLKAQEITALRQLLRRKLGANFGSRFDKAVAMRL